MLKIEEMTEECRYSDVLENLIDELGGVSVLRLDYISDYQGHVDIDVLLTDGRVFSYLYSYGSCSGCDEWEELNLSDDEIKNVIMQEATFFESVDTYNKWLEMRKS